MFFVAEDIVAESWKNCAPVTSNKFWGLLTILKQIRKQGFEKIDTGKSYIISEKQLAEDLQSLFHFGDDIRTFSEKGKYYITFSSKWGSAVPQLFFNGTPEISDVSIVALYNTPLDSKLTIEDLVILFLDTYCLRNDDTKNWFRTSKLSKNVEYVSHHSSNDWLKTTKKRIYSEIKRRLQFKGGNYNLSFEKPYSIQAHPGELTRAPFIQTLYSGQAVLECLLITKFNFAEYYSSIPEGKSKQNVSEVSLHFPYNRIIYGAPGTGKSFLLESESNVFNNRKMRITFFPDYSYSKFVGAYKPVTYYKQPSDKATFYWTRDKAMPAIEIENDPVIDYRFVPGPFLIALIAALKSNDPYLLIIEEINRANAAEVFGEIFQLLDRDNGQSKYRVTLSKEAMDFLYGELGEQKHLIEDGVYLPSNFFLWATMNSADQGVHPLDSAFKRRWTFEYLPLNKFEEHFEERTIQFDGATYNWNKFRSCINEELSNLKVPEDKLIGPFFLKDEELKNEEIIKNKLLLYLREDVLRHNHDKLFNGSKNFYQLLSIYGKGILLRKDIYEKLL